MRSRILLAFFIANSLCGSALRADQPIALHEEIDRIVAAAGNGTTVPPAEDAEFLRRVCLDLTGQIPSASDVKDYLADTSSEKRTKLIDRLLTSPQGIRHLQQALDIWLMQRRPERHVLATEWRTYLHESVVNNKPWDKLTVELLSADGVDSASRPAARFFLDRECTTEDLVRDISAVFLGRDIRCAQCHDHPIVDDYRQAHFFGIAAFVDRIFLFDDKDQKRKVLAEKSDGETAFTSALTQVRGVASPQVFDGPSFRDPVFAQSDIADALQPEGSRPVPAFSRRSMLPAAIVDHPAFRRNAANRLWSLMFGRGIVEPVDQDHSDNPATSPELLQLLADRLAALKYDLRLFLRELALTELYARSSHPGDRSEPTPKPLLVIPLRKLSPEQLAWSWLKATGHQNAEAATLISELQTNDPTRAETLKNSPADLEAALFDRLKPQADIVIKMFVTSLPGESTRSETTAGQALFLLNGETLRNWIAARPGNLLDQLSRETNEDRIAEQLYRATLSRMPEPSEVELVRRTLGESFADRSSAICDMIEGLICCTEFRFNH